MPYTKQTWADWDDDLTREENIAAGALITAEKLDHLEDGVAAAAAAADEPGPQGEAGASVTAIALELAVDGDGAVAGGTGIATLTDGSTVDIAVSITTQ